MDVHCDRDRDQQLDGRYFCNSIDRLCLLYSHSQVFTREDRSGQKDDYISSKKLHKTMFSVRKLAVDNAACFITLLVICLGKGVNADGLRQTISIPNFR